MSYGHAEKVAAIVAREIAAAADRKKPVPLIDPRLYDDPDVRRILAEHDIAALYLALKDARLTQRQIAELTGQSQSEVSEILDGRKVGSYNLLVRIAKGLRIPRELMGLSFGAYPEGPSGVVYGGEVAVADPEGVAEMLRRHVLALGPVAAVAYNPVAKLAELLERLELPEPSPVPLPSRLSGVHVEKVRDLVRRLGEADNTSVSDPEVLNTAAAWAGKLLDVPGTELIKRALRVAVAELHIEAGWSGFNSGLYNRMMFHYARALELSTEAGDAYLQALVLKYAGAATVEHGHPNDGLKMLQYGGVTALDIPPDKPRAVVVGEEGRAAIEATVLVHEATALSRLDELEKANTALARSRELWTPTPADPYGDLDRPAAVLELERGRLDAAEPFAVASMRRWDGGSHTSRTQSAIVLGTIHVRAGEPRGLQLAHSAISAADKISSVRVRRRLVPLAEALDARRNSDAQQLARMARQVAATRA